MTETYPLDADIAHYYRSGRELDRLVGSAVGRLEFERTIDVLRRWLPGSGRLLDVGGGPGRYAVWLAANGFDVELFEPVELHVDQASELAEQAGIRVVAEVADARALPRPDGYADAVLLLGPLYHLPNRAERQRCLREARRVLRPEGRLIAAGISRFAGVLDNLAGDLIDDDEWWSAIQQALRSGEHHNPERTPGLFTTSYFHRPDDLRAEVAEGGFEDVHLVPIEGPALVLTDLKERAADPRRWSRLLEALRLLETEPSIVGTTGHLLAIGTRPR